MTTETAPKGDGDRGTRADRYVAKYPTGIEGLDTMTRGGLPRDRVTIVMGAPGTGKTIVGLQTLAYRASEGGEPCIFVAFEESIDKLRSNAASFDWGHHLIDNDAITFIDGRMPPDATFTGAFDLSALLAGLSAIMAQVGARLVVFDAIDMLLAGLKDEWLERRELTRLDNWVQGSNISAILTVKSFGDGGREQRRAEFLQYMADCVIQVSRTTTETESSRRIVVEKYRGASFAANPAPVVFGEAGCEVVVLQASRGDYPTFVDRVSTGVARLDAVVEGGYRRGGSVLISGSPGTSKTTLGASFLAAACARGEKALFVSFDESGANIIENMKSVGIDLGPHVASGHLTIAALVSTGRSPEEHYLRIRALMDEHGPTCLVIDPISALLKSGYPFSRAICEAMLDNAKARGVTVLCTSLLEQVSGETEMSASHVSTVADTWIHVSYVAREGERNRAITIIKSRGTAHSNQVRELVLSPTGIDLVDVYIAEGEVLMGSARAQKEAEAARQQIMRDLNHSLERMAAEAEIAELRQKVQAATLALQLKEREAEFTAEAVVREGEAIQRAAGDRVILRRSLAEARAARLAAGKASEGR